MSFARRLLSILLPVAIGACSAGRPDDSVSLSQSPLVVGGCQCVSSGGCSGLSYSDVPSDGKYYVTTFGGGTDTGTMAGGGTADGTWAYVADKARFACGVKLLVTANGKQCVAQVADCGPNRCVEEAASGSCGSHFPVLDASPYITKYLLGLSGVGWSDKKIVGAVPIDSSSVVGCPGVAVGGGGSGGSGGGSGGNPPGGGGSSGGGGSPPVQCSPPSCTGCADCFAQCMCDVGDTQACTDACFGGGTGGAGTGGGGGGAPTECAPPLCDGCADCFGQCVCDGNSADTCTNICDSPSGTGGDPGLETGACELPQCECGNCVDTCSCQGIDETMCFDLCTKGDAPGDEPAAANTTPDAHTPKGSCAATIAPGDARNRSPSALIVIGLAFLLRRRQRRTR